MHRNTEQVKAKGKRQKAKGKNKLTLCLLPFSLFQKIPGHGIKTKLLPFAFCLLPFAFLIQPFALSFAFGGQQHDALNEQEGDLVREAQEIDQRTAVFLKIAERRLRALEDAGSPTGNPAADSPTSKESKKAQKKREEEASKWGSPPTGTRLQLLDGYTRVMEELEDKIEDAFERTPKNEGLRKALQTVNKTSEEYLARLRKFHAANPSLQPEEERSYSRAFDITQNALDGAKKFLAQSPKK